MNLRELLEVNLAGVLGNPVRGKIARSAAADSEREVGTIPASRAKSQVQSAAKAQEKEETHKTTAAFCFGRFNPAHRGHAKVWEAVANAGQHWYIGTNPTTIGPDDPLPFNIKTAWMTAIDPGIKGHILGEKSVVTLASEIYKQVGEDALVSYVTDSKDWEWSGKLLHSYNGKAGPHGYYNFKTPIRHVESPRVTSASDLRAAARAGNEKLFYQLSGTDPSLTVYGKTYFETVAEACGQHPEKIKRSKNEKNTREDAAGVGTITDQNSTVDVNKSTPGKNLRAFNLIKEVNAKIREGKVTQRHPDHDAVSQGVHRSRDVGGYDRVYHMNRVMMAMAMADGKDTKPVDSPAETWAEKYNTHHPYTKEEYNMVQSAFKTVPSDQQEVSPFSKSKEPDDTHKISPVAQRKRNRHGV